MNTQTRYWSITWDTNIQQKKIPHEDMLSSFLNRISDDFVFQYELGSKRKKEHIQGVFTLTGKRQSRMSVLRTFEKTFKNVSGLTLSPVYDKIAIRSYVTKKEGRIRGPFYGGKKDMFDRNFASAKLRSWQYKLFKILTGETQDILKDRKVVLIQDCCGNTGKSWFQKWLRVGQKTLLARSLPVSSVDRLISAVHILNNTYEVDVYLIDLTRTQGEDQSYNDLFAAIEQIKNGHIVDVMYGKYNESIFKPPMIIIFTNSDISRFRNYLSNDRWLVYTINSQGELIKTDTGYEHFDFYNLTKK